MNYIGSKLTLLDFLREEIERTLIENKDEIDFNKLTFGDGFAGTGIVGINFKKLGCKVISNDIQYYSYVMIRNYIQNNSINSKKIKKIINDLNDLPGVNGFIYNNYSLGGTKGKEFERMYYTDSNAQRCDAIRIKLNELLENKIIDDNEYYYLLACLINAVDKVANTASVYGAFLKKFKRSASLDLKIVPLDIISSTQQNAAYNLPIGDWIKKVSGDILYLDPPYNARQYCSNYHLLETIAKYDNPEIKGKTGLRDYTYQKSKWCSKATVLEEFENIIKEAKFKYIFLSYNNEGLMTLDQVKDIMKNYGSYRLAIKKYKRFKADSNRDNKADYTYEYLHCLVKF